MKKKSVRRQRAGAFCFTKTDTAIAKLAAIVFMILHHLFGFTDRILPQNMYNSLFVLHGRPIEEIICAPLNLCVVMFLLLSGYGTYITMRKEKNISKAVAGRIFNLLVTVCEVMLIFVPIDYFLGVRKANITASWEISYNLKSIILGMLGFEKYNSEWWFILPFMVLLMMTPLLLRLVGRKKNDFFTSFLIIFGVGIFSWLGINTLLTFEMFKEFAYTVWGTLLRNTLHFLPAYAMGMVFARFQVFSWLYRISPRSFLRYPVWLFVLSGSLYLRHTFNASMYDFLLAAPIIFSIVCLFRELPPVVWLANKASRYITLVWLTHSFYIYQFGQGIVYASHNPVLIFCTELVLAFGTAVVIYRIFYGLRRWRRRAQRSS